MDKAHIYRELEKEFVSTFIGELLPGVLHNFANPLNGIMGRSKLLQRRFNDFSSKLQDIGHMSASDHGLEKIARDIEIIVSESERFFALFKDLAGKLASINSGDHERINIAKMIDSELRFHDFYLDFKHDIKKNIKYRSEVPDIIGSHRDYSICFSSLIRYCKDRLNNCNDKEITIITGHDSKYISIDIYDKGNAISEVCQELSKNVGFDQDISSLAGIDRLICRVFQLLQCNGAHVEILCEGGINKLSIFIPYC